MAALSDDFVEDPSEVVQIGQEVGNFLERSTSKKKGISRHLQKFRTKKGKKCVMIDDIYIYIYIL